MAGGSAVQGQPVEGKGTKLAGAGVAGVSTEKGIMLRVWRWSVKKDRWESSDIPHLAEHGMVSHRVTRCLKVLVFVSPDK